MAIWQLFIFSMPEYEDDDADMAEQLVFTRYIDRAFMARKKDVDVQTRGLGATIICCESDDVYVSVLGGANFPSFVCPPHKKIDNTLHLVKIRGVAVSTQSTHSIGPRPRKTNE